MHYDTSVVVMVKIASIQKSERSIFCSATVVAQGQDLVKRKKSWKKSNLRKKRSCSTEPVLR
jgi:hypothetical protein